MQYCNKFKKDFLNGPQQKKKKKVRKKKKLDMSASSHEEIAMHVEINKASKFASHPFPVIWTLASPINQMHSTPTGHAKHYGWYKKLHIVHFQETYTHA